MPFSVKGNGDFSYSMYEGLHSFGKEHRMVFGFCSDVPEKIAIWHFFEEDGGFVAKFGLSGEKWKLLPEDSAKVYGE